jgi:hypothetical protein
MRTREQICERSRIHVGHREVTPNRSPLIDAWLRRCGLGPGYPWCAAFASWCVEAGCIYHPSATIVEPVACAGALRLGHMFPATLDPMPGDLMYFATDDKGAGHVGIVVAGNAESVLCIEGNSANMIRYVRRLRSEVLFARTRREIATLPPINPRLNAPLVRVSFEGTR